MSHVFILQLFNCYSCRIPLVDAESTQTDHIQGSALLEHHSDIKERNPWIKAETGFQYDFLWIETIGQCKI